MGYKFIDPQPDLDGNRCSSKVAGVAVQCEGECPCPQSAAVCEFHKNLDGDNVCPPYKFVVDGNTISVYRPPCLADDLEVNVGVWRGESASKDGATYPNGWGVLTYKLNDTLNRDKYKGNMVYGVREGHGALYWKDKSYYSGTWKNNKKHGEGTLFYANGDIYTGTWSEETKTGQGKYFYATGGKLHGEGKFENGRMTGEGVYAFADGGLFDSSAGLYYPNRDDKSKYFEAHFDGHTLRVNKAVKAKPTGSPYG